jgi:hypothetical protein
MFANQERNCVMHERTGQCLCGAVSFKLATQPLVTRVCWCRDCQHLAANGTVNLLVAAEGLSVSGVLSEHTKTAASGNAVTRSFCPVCGTHLFARSSARPQFRVLRAGNLDEPSSIQPNMNIWAASAPSWACLDPSLERVEQQPLPPAPSPSTGKS